MSTASIRATSAVLLFLCVCLYLWMSLRSEPKMATIPFFPHAMTSYFDLHPLQRSFPAFFSLAGLAAGAVAGGRRIVQLFALMACLAAPLIKDMMQLGLATRHFNSDAISLGMLGGLVGFATSYRILKILVAPRPAPSSHGHQH